MSEGTGSRAVDSLHLDNDKTPPAALLEKRVTNTGSNLLIKNGLAAMFVALVGGFMLTFSMLGGISLSPLPVFFGMEMPGTAAGWRAVHLGMLMNGIMAIALGLAMRRLLVTETGERIVVWGTLIAVWGNFCFYLFSMFGQNHGLSLGTNRLGEGNLAGALAFVPALVGAVTLMTAIIILLRAEPAD